MIRYLFIIFLLISTFLPSNTVYVYAQGNIQEPKFNSYNEAISWVKKNFTYETTDTSRSSWIRGLYYFYADGKGFLIINMKGKEYIFRGVPRNIWEDFKTAPSLGKYYHAHIRGRYFFSI